MTIKIKFSSLRTTRGYEYLLRFGLGGLVTMSTGVIAQTYGPEVGGLFLSFPAIFCASATLVEKHERERKEKAGLVGTNRAKDAAALDAAGASLGAVGLLGFGLVAWGLGLHQPWRVLGLALGLWTLISILLWSQRHRLWLRS